MTQDTNTYPFKQWLKWRLTRAYGDAGDVLAKKLREDKQLPARGSYAIYTAHLRLLAYPEADRKLFDTLWQEMKASQS